VGECTIKGFGIPANFDKREGTDILRKINQPTMLTNRFLFLLLACIVFMFNSCSDDESPKLQFIEQDGSSITLKNANLYLMNSGSYEGSFMRSITGIITLRMGFIQRVLPMISPVMKAPRITFLWV